MSGTFDELVESSWAQFQERLTARIGGLDTGMIEIEQAQPEESALPFVSIERDGEWLQAELVGLSPDNGFQAAEALGWVPPEPEGDSPCWAVRLPSDEVEVLVAMVSGALRYVYAVEHPAFLAGEERVGKRLIGSRPPRGVEAEDDEEHEPDIVMGFPSGVEELVEMIEQTLRPTYGPDVVRDDDGDFPILTGLVPMWIQARHDAPLVRLFSFVVRSIRDVRQARIEVGILNRRTQLLKFTVEDGTITATYDLPAAPFFGSQLLFTIDRVSELLNDIAADTASRVNGKLWFDDVRDAAPSAGREDSA